MTLTFEKAVSPLGRTANRKSPAEDRFWAKCRLDRRMGCLEWTGCVNPVTGYGEFGDSRKLHLAHRWSYEHFVGPIPEGMHIDHLCNNRRCVCPSHLEAVTQGENNQRSWDRRTKITHCKRGHEFTDENTIYRPRKGRECRTCRNTAIRASRRARKAAEQ